MKQTVLKAFLRSSSLMKIPARTKFLIFQEICETDSGRKGVFAAQNIPKGAVVWAFDNINCERLTKQTVAIDDEETLSTRIQKGFLNKKLDKFIVLEDGAQYTNHALEANLRWGSDDETWVATRNILDGEEMTFDFRQFGRKSDCDWLEPLFSKLQPSVLEFESKLNADQSN